MAVKTFAAIDAATYAMRSGQPTVAADNDAHMGVGMWPANSRTVVAVLKFDLDWTNVQKITSAKLKLVSYDPGTGVEHLGLTPTAEAPVRVTILDAAFLDLDTSAEGSYASGGYNTSLAWNTNYSFNGRLIRAEGTVNEIDITNMLNGWAPISVKKSDGKGGGAKANHGLVVGRLPTSGIPNPEALWYSDKAANPALRPVIELTYDPIPNPPDVLLTDPVSPVSQIEGEVFGGDFIPGRLDDKLSAIQINVYPEGEATPLWSANRNATGSETAAAHFTEPLPELLRSGTAYEWQARVKNQYGEWSLWSALTDLVVTTEAPTLASAFPSGSKATLNGVYFGAHYEDANQNPLASYRIQVADGSLTPGDPLWETTTYFWDTGDVAASLEEIEPSGETVVTGRQLATPDGSVIVDRGGLIRRLYGGLALAPGTYDYRVRATDSLGGVSDWVYGTFTLTQAWEPDPGETENETGYARRKPRQRILIKGFNLGQQRFYVHNATGGTFKLTLDGQETAALGHTATEAQVKAALEALTNVSTVTVTKSGTTYTVDFADEDGIDTVMVPTSLALTGTGAIVYAWHTRGPGELLAVIEDAAHIGVSEFYNASGEVFFSLPVTHPQVSVIEPWQVHWAYEEYRGEGWKELNAGLITEFDATSDDVVFHGFDYLGIASLDVDDRFNSEAAPDNAAALWPAAGGGAKYVNKTIKEVVTDQLNRMIYAIRAPLGFMTLGTVDDMDEKVTIFSTFKARLPFIAGLIESHRAGTGLRTRVRVRKLIDGTYQLRVDNNPGMDRDALLLEYGGLVQGFRVVPFGDFGTRINAIGRAYNSLKVEHLIVPTPAPSGEPADYNENAYGRLPKPRLWQDITDANDLHRRAKQYAKQVGKLGKNLGLALRVDALRVKDGWDICDSLPTKIARGVVDVDRFGSGYYTVWGWALRIEPDGHSELVLSLLPREDDEAPDLDLIPSRPIHTGSEWQVGWTPPPDSPEFRGPNVTMLFKALDTGLLLDDDHAMDEPRDIITGSIYVDLETGLIYEQLEDGTWIVVQAPQAPPRPHSVVVSSRRTVNPSGVAVVNLNVSVTQ